MPKISVNVCLGTSCFVMGASLLQELTRIIENEYAEQVEITSGPCQRFCSVNWSESKAPYVKVDDDIVSEATVEKVLIIIKEKLKKQTDSQSSGIKG